MVTNHDNKAHDSKPKDTSMSTSEAGRKGGEETAKRGPEFYSEIGSKQGKDNNPGNFANRPKAEVRKAAKEGGHNSHRGDTAKN